MTEVFDAWAAERVQKPQQQFLPPTDNAYPRAQLHQPLQPQQQAAYYYNSYVAELPSAPAHTLPMSPPLTPNTPSMYLATSSLERLEVRRNPSPAGSQATPNSPYLSQPPLQQAIEMPVELPGSTTLAVPAPVPARSTSTEVDGPLSAVCRETS